MPSLFFSSRQKRNWFLLTFIASVFIFSGCASVHESPTRFGYSIVTMPGVQLGESKSSLHAVLGYYHFNFKGGGGHNNFFQLGGQWRKELNKSSENGLWLGGELTYLYINSAVNNSSMKPHASAFTIGPAVGYRFQLGKVPFNLYAVPSFLHRGEFNTGGAGSNGYLGRFAFDIPFMSLLSKKGR